MIYMDYQTYTMTNWISIINKDNKQNIGLSQLRLMRTQKSLDMIL